VSAVSGVLCVLLIVLWVRSYWWFDQASLPYPSNQSVLLFSCQGRFGSCHQEIGLHQFLLTHAKVEQVVISADDSGQTPTAWWPQVLRWKSGEVEVHIPFWMPTLTLATLCAIPWVHFKRTFSLRTLLIATTLIAVVLGMVVWRMS
jgi:hypothetical protein